MHCVLQNIIKIIFAAGRTRHLTFSDKHTDLSFFLYLSHTHAHIYAHILALFITLHSCAPIFFLTCRYPSSLYLYTEDKLKQFWPQFCQPLPQRIDALQSTGYTNSLVVSISNIISCPYLSLLMVHLSLLRR